MSTHFRGRTLARSQALQLLFQAEANGRTVQEVLEGDYALEEGPLDDFGRRLAIGADGVRHDLDAIIATRSATWSINRMPSVDRNLLRLALYEMMYVDEVDIPIAIDEVVELAKAYGTDESAKFINGVLGTVADDIEAGIDPVEKAHDILAERGETAADVQYALEGRFDVWEEPQEESLPFGSDREHEMSGGVWQPEPVYPEDDYDGNDW